MTDCTTCDFCGMEIASDPIRRTIGGVEHCFDTEDCTRLYQHAFDAHMLDEVLADAPEHRRSLAQRLGLHVDTAFFTIDGMWCASCAKVVEKVLKQGEGVVDAQISFAAGKGRIDYDPRVTEVSELVRRIEKLGYVPRLATTAESKKSDHAEERLLIQVIVALAFGMQVMLLYIARLYPAYAAGDTTSDQVRILQWLGLILTAPVLFYGGSTFLRGAAHELRVRHPGMDTLVALGTLSAFAYSAWATVVGGHPTYFDSVAMIVEFVMFGRYIEVSGGARARQDVRGLMELQPDRAWVLGPSGALLEMPAQQLKPGHRIVVKPGERIPVDAVVLSGDGHADESLLTGEAGAVRKHEGDSIWAGTLVVDGALTAQVEHDVGSSRLAGIRTLVEHTLETRAPAERLADRVSLVLTLGVIALAIVTGIGWTLAGASPAHALITAVAVLVVACPCALGLATPLAISVALGAAAREGVIVRNGAALETAGQTSVVALDKTGTVTLGHLEVTETHGGSREMLLSLASAAEQFSEHPLGRAIVSASAIPPAAHDFTSKAGLGVTAVLEDSNEHVSVGRLELMGREPADDMLAAAAMRETHGETVVWVAKDGEIAGFIALRDEIDPTAHSALGTLAKRGLGPVLLSGDSEATTRSVAAELEIDRYQARLTPELKADAIGTLQAAGELVAMVGDGVNDAPSLARANLSVTVAGGSDIAAHTSDVVLSRADLRLIPWFLDASIQTRRIIHQNLGWAVGYNAVALPLAAFGLITPGIAAAAMATSSLLVVGNSLRLRGLLRQTIRA